MKKTLSEGAIAGHMMHLYENTDLSFADIANHLPLFLFVCLYLLAPLCIKVPSFFTMSVGFSKGKFFIQSLVVLLYGCPYS